MTAALALRARQQGLRVRVFKTGPDFVDPTILEHASGQPVHQLDLWMVGKAQCQRLLHEAAAGSDLLLIEGVMGLYDGDPSTADLAMHFGLPLLLVIDGSAMAQTFGAIAEGLRVYRPGLQVYGVVANRVAGARHAQMLERSLPSALRFLAALPRSAEITLPERHLGLVQGFEVADLQARLNAAANAWLTPPDLQGLPLCDLPAVAVPEIAPRLRGLRIAVARDAAFSFLYPANLETLTELGAELRFFSPLSGTPLPECDAIYLPGGYPELHAAALAQQQAWWQALRAHHAACKPIVAECGGMMTVFETLVDRDGVKHPMAGLLGGSTAMQPRLQALGLQSVEWSAGILRGHTYHHSSLQTSITASLQARRSDGGPGESVFRQARLTASYVHFYFASNPSAAAELFLP